jgi:ADP-ribosylglycohydrolase
LNRRRFLQNSVVASTAVQAAASAQEAQTRQAGGKRLSLRDKFFGCIVGVHVGSAMGAPCEGWSWQRIEQKHGTIEKLLPYMHYNNGWMREPGTTEDGVERQKLMITAIIEKKDRVTAEDVRRIWVKYMLPEQPNMVSEAFEGRLLQMARSSVPAADIGRYSDYSGLNSFARSCHPIGLINAGDVESAAEDVFEVGQLYQASNSRGLAWASVTGMSIAAATKPGATVESVIATVLKGDPRFAANPSWPKVAEELERNLERTRKYRDFRELRTYFDGVYSGEGMPYSHSSANEVVTKAFCVFVMTKGVTKDAVIAGVNMGRDTDCVTAVAAGISGALTGAGSVPPEWIKQVDYATTQMRVTNSRRSMREHADGLYEAYRARLRKARSLAELMERA